MRPTSGPIPCNPEDAGTESMRRMHAAGEMPAELLQNRILRLCTHQCLDLFSIHKQNHGRNAAHVELFRRRRILIHIQLHQLQPARQFACHFLEDRAVTRQGAHQDAQKSTSTGSVV